MPNIQFRLPQPRIEGTPGPQPQPGVGAPQKPVAAAPSGVATTPEGRPNEQPVGTTGVGAATGGGGSGSSGGAPTIFGTAGFSLSNPGSFLGGPGQTGQLPPPQSPSQPPQMPPMENPGQLSVPAENATGAGAGADGGGIPGGFGAPAVPEDYDARQGQPEPVPRNNPYPRGTKEFRQWEAQKNEIIERNRERGFTLEQMGFKNKKEEGQSQFAGQQALDFYGPGWDSTWTYDMVNGMRARTGSRDTGAHTRWEKIPADQMRAFADWNSWKARNGSWIKAHGSAYNAWKVQQSIAKAVKAKHWVPVGEYFRDDRGAGQAPLWYNEFGQQIATPASAAAVAGTGTGAAAMTPAQTEAQAQQQAQQQQAQAQGFLPGQGPGDAPLPLYLNPVTAPGYTSGAGAGFGSGLPAGRRRRYGPRLGSTDPRVPAPTIRPGATFNPTNGQFV